MGKFREKNLGDREKRVRLDKITEKSAKGWGGVGKLRKGIYENSKKNDFVLTRNLKFFQKQGWILEKSQIQTRFDTRSDVLMVHNFIFISNFSYNFNLTRISRKKLSNFGETDKTRQNKPENCWKREIPPAPRPSFGETSR